MNAQPESAPASRAWVVAAGAVLVAVLAFVVRLVGIDQPPITDELYHLIAGANWAETGRLAIADGLYERAAPFSKLVGAVLERTDGSLMAARLVCVAIGSALVGLVFGWTARNVSWRAATVTSVLLLLLPGAIFLSQHIRFYSLHALTFFAFAAIVYFLQVTRPGRVAAVGWAAVAALLAWFGLKLQVTFLVGVVAVLAWVVLVNSAEIRRVLTEQALARYVVAAAGIALLVALAIGFPAIQRLADVYMTSALWNTGDTPAYYHNLYKAQLGLFWSLAPFAVIAALAARPIPAGFCLTVFAVAFVAQSLGGMRQERFLFYALPFFFILWGIAADAGLAWLSSTTRSLLRELPLIENLPWLGRVATGLFVTGAAVFALMTTPALEQSVKNLAGRGTDAGSYWGRYDTDWRSASGALRDLAGEVDVVLVSQSLHAVYYIGDYDYALNATEFEDVRRADEDVTLDPRSGRHVFHDAAVLSNVMACIDSGMIVVHEPAWGNRTRIPDDTAGVIESIASRVPAFDRFGLRVYTWQATTPRPKCNPDAFPGKVVSP